MNNVVTFANEIKRITRGFGFRFALGYITLIIMNLNDVYRNKSLGIADRNIINISRNLRVTIQGHKLIIIPESMPTVRETMLRNSYDLNMRREYDTIIDLGAGLGDFSLMAGKVAKRVIAVECKTVEIPEKFNYMMRLNGLTNFNLLSKIASNVSDERHISINKIIQDFELKQISFLKIDIEGGEKVLFEGDVEWLRLTKEVSMEVHPCFGVDQRKILKILDLHGFKTSLLNKDLKVVRELDANGMGYIRGKNYSR